MAAALQRKADANRGALAGYASLVADTVEAPVPGRADATILLVDSDSSVRDGIDCLLRSAGWRSRTFASARELLAEWPFAGLGCVVFDMNMPEMSGQELQAWMVDHDCPLPIVFLSGRCTVSMSVSAMRAGAIDVLEKPADAEALLNAVATAVERHRKALVLRQHREDVEHRLDRLTKRERQVLMQVSLGRLNKQIAGDLGIAEKTVKVHRARAMAKVGVRNVATLVHLCEWLEAWPWRHRAG